MAGPGRPMAGGAEASPPPAPKEVRQPDGERWRLAVFFLVAVVVTAAFSLSRSELFSVAEVSVVGAERVPPSHIVALSGISLGQNLFEVDCRRSAARIRSDPRISSCRVARQLPDTIRIRVSERRAVAMVPYAGSFFELDREGRAIAFHRTLQDVTLPLVGGVLPQKVELGQVVTAPFLNQVLLVAELLSLPTLGQVSEVAWTERQTLEIYTVDGIRVDLGAAEDLPMKIQVFERMLAELGSERQRIHYIDLSVASRPTVKLRPQVSTSGGRTSPGALPQH